jgi:hypothetical protein
MMRKLRDALLLVLVGMAFGAFMFYVIVASPASAWGLR